MATKIQLRRDVSTSWTNSNPILAQGEPGMEIDTRKFKLGDGVTPWTGLSYSDKNDMQDFFILLQQGTDSWYPTVNSVSIDGDSWTASKTLGSGGTGGEDPMASGSGWQQFASYNVAAGNGKVVYTVYFAGNNYYFGDDWYSGLAVADNPFEAPRLIQQPGTFSTPDDNEHEIEWDNIQFEGGYFVATGNYYYNQSPWYYAPCFAYSQDGENWTWGKVDQDFIQSRPGLEDYGACGMLFTGVSYNGSGWLFTNQWYVCGSDTSPYNAGAFYVTDLSVTLQQSNYTGNAPTHDSADSNNGPGNPKGRIIWAGSRWVGTDFVNNIYYNTSTNPLQGSWTEYDISAAQIQAFGNSVSDIMQIDSVNLGGTQYTVILLEDGLVMSSTDGVNWAGTCVVPYTDHITDITSGSDTVITFNDLGGNWSGFLGTIAVDIAGLPNGTFADGRYFVNPDSGELYSTPGTGSPVTSGDSFSAININATMTFGDNILHINDNVATSGLKVGMAVQGYNWFGGPFTDNGNRITRIDTVNNTVYMERPMGDTGTHDIYFGPSVVLNYGYVNSGTMTHGNGKLVVITDTGMFGLLPSSTTDLVNWNTSIGFVTGNEGNWNSYNSWFNMFDYYGFTFGTTTSHDNSMISNNQAWLPGYGVTGDYRISGIANSATLGSNFQVDVTGITWDAGFVHQQLYMNPEQGWFLGQDSNMFYGGGESMTGVGSTNWNGGEGAYDVFIRTGNGDSGNNNQAQWTFANPDGPFPALLWLPTDSADIVNDSGYSITLNGLYVEINAPSGNGNLEYSPPDNGDTGYLTFTPAAVSGLYPVPATSRGSEGDVAGMLAANSGWLYYCSANWDGTTNIWKREPWSNETW
jgi:hypothetical protein